MEVLSEAEYKYSIPHTPFFFFLSIWVYFTFSAFHSHFIFLICFSFAVRFLFSPFVPFDCFLSFVLLMLHSHIWQITLRTFYPLQCFFYETKTILTSSHKLRTSRAKNVWPSAPHSLYVTAWFLARDWRITYYAGTCCVIRSTKSYVNIKSIRIRANKKYCPNFSPFPTDHKVFVLKKFTYL